MATKCIVLGEKERKIATDPIVLTNALHSDGKFKSIHELERCCWDNLELISKNYTDDEEDLIFGYDDNRSAGCLYLGHWNDGFVK